MSQPGRQQGEAAVIAFPIHLRLPNSGLLRAVRSHRLPVALENALLREAALCGDGVTGLEQAITARLHPAPIDFDQAQTILLFGPSGAGKSAVAAKIARIAKGRGRDVEIVAAAQGLAGSAKSRKTLAITDCAGFNPRNARACAAFTALGDLAHAETIGVLSALADAQEISEIAAAVSMRRVIVTGLDMTRRLGSVAAACLQGASLAHVTRGAEGGLESLAPATLAALLAAPVAAH
jgi:flagellar biosynthesis protein FlhF